jgi:hypothetical protein
VTLRKDTEAKVRGKGREEVSYGENEEVYKDGARGDRHGCCLFPGE